MKQTHSLSGKLSVLTSLVGTTASLVACLCFFVYDFVIQSDFRLDDPATMALLQRDLGVLALVLLVSVLLAKVAARRMTLSIAGPIAGLAVATTEISDSQNFALRLPEQEFDELNTLVRAFNQMMTAIEARNTDLKAAHGLFDGFVNHSPTLAFIKDDKLRYVFANAHLRRVLGKSKNDVLGQVDAVLWPPDIARRLEEEDREALAGTTNTQMATSGMLRSYRTTMVLPTPQGPRNYNVLRFLLIHPDGHIYLACSAIDETDRILAQKALGRSEERYALAVRGASDGIWDWDILGGSIYYSDRCLEILGGDPERQLQASENALEGLLGRIHKDDSVSVRRSLDRLVSGEDEQLEIEFRLCPEPGQEEGAPCWLLNRATALRDAGRQALRVAGFLTDITARKQNEEQLRRDAFRDALTGLPNRALFNDRLQRAWERQRRYPETLFGVLFLDLDGFKGVNDSLGHSVGDLLLIEVGQRLLGTVRSEDTVARLGGDEFTLLVEELRDPSDAVRVAERILSALKEPFELGPHVLKSASSIGIALSSSKYGRAEEMLTDADSAMYLAKRSGKATYRIFDAAMHSDAQARLALEADLRLARGEGRFALHYLPVWDLKAQRIVGAEALLRLRQGDDWVAAGDFLMAAENSGLLFALGRELIPQTLQAWQSAGLFRQGLKLTLNLSLRQFQHPRLLPDLTEWTRVAEVEPSSICLEFTEAVFVRDREGARQTMDALQKLGFQLGLEDFGTGTSSLENLRDFPFSYFKVDRSYLGGDKHKAFLNSFAQMAQGLGINCVLEGIESAKQLELALSLGYTQGQGFLWSKPAPLPELTALLQAPVLP